MVTGWLNYIRTRQAATSFAWIDSIFLVMNPLILLWTFPALFKQGVAVFRIPLLQVAEKLTPCQLPHNTRRRGHLFQKAAY